jgi:transposase-like protein/IS1 family transposase
VKPENRLPLAPAQAFCPNPACPAKGRRDAGNLRVHSQKEQRFLCRVCQKTFSARQGTPFYRLQHQAVRVTLVLTLLAHGCPVQAIVAAFGLDERTVRAWLAKGGAHCQAVHEHLVEQPQDLGQVQCDEIRVKAQRGVLWLAMALCVQTRLWLGAEVSPQRDGKLIEHLIQRVKRCASVLGGPLLFCMDGLASYPTTIKRVLREKLPRHGERGRCAWVAWPRLHLAQVVKQYEGHRVVGVARRIYQGSSAGIAAIIKATQGAGDINTAYIERLNATFRSCLTSLARRTRALTRTSASLHAGTYLVGTVYNFCTEHESLRLPGLIGGHKWLGRTPAMAAGLTTHCWSVKELLSYRVPPGRWRPPKRRGRRSAELKELIKRWG